jgi:hypothetical protein
LAQEEGDGAADASVETPADAPAEMPAAGEPTAEATSPAANAEVNAAPPKRRGKRRTLALDLKAAETETTAATVNSLVTIALSEDEALDVIASSDLAEMAGVEAQKQALGCDTEGSCLAELADAMGAELIVYGDIGRLGGLVIVNLHLFDATAAAPVNRVTVETTDEAALPGELRRGVRNLVAPAVGRQPEVAVATVQEPEPEPEPASVAWLPWGVAAGGGVMIVGGLALATIGAVPWFGLQGSKDALDSAAAGIDSRSGAAELEALAAAGKAAEADRAAWNGWGMPSLVTGAAVAGVGVGVLGAGVAWALLSGGEE